MMVEICQRVLDGLGMQAEWVLGIVVPIAIGKGDTRNLCSYIAMKLLDDVTEVVEMVFEKGFEA